MSTCASIAVKLGLAAFILLGVIFAPRAGAEEYSRSYSIAGRASVQVRAEWGVVRVTASDGSQVRFDVRYQRRYVSRAQSGEEPHIDSRRYGNLVELTAIVDERAWGWIDGGPLDIEVQMPRNADLRVETTNGGIGVSSVNGSVSIRTSNGEVYAERLSGSIDIGSTNGGITLDSLRGAMKVRTTRGSIRAKSLDGRCELATSTGAVQVAGRFDSLDITSGTGRVVARAESGSRMSSGWSIRTTSARVDLSLPPDLRADLDAVTTEGGIALSLPVEVQGYRGKTYVRGTLNGGGPEMFIRTTQAGIRVGGI